MAQSAGQSSSSAGQRSGSSGSSSNGGRTQNVGQRSPYGGYSGGSFYTPGALSSIVSPLLGVNAGLNIGQGYSGNMGKGWGGYSGGAFYAPGSLSGMVSPSLNQGFNLSGNLGSQLDILKNMLAVNMTGWEDQLEELEGDVGEGLIPEKSTWEQIKDLFNPPPEAPQPEQAPKKGSAPTTMPLNRFNTNNLIGSLFNRGNVFGNRFGGVASGGRFGGNSILGGKFG